MKVTSSDAYPLRWPDGHPRSDSRESAKFKVSFYQAVDNLIAELGRMRANYVVVSTNVPLRRDGRPYADGDPEDPGVAVYFELNGTQHVIACDRWMSVRSNTQALALTVEALRGIERWGSTEIMKRAWQGFLALPPAVITPRSWREVFGFRPDAPLNLASVRALYRKEAEEAHPDKGGTHERMAELNGAMEAAERELAGEVP